jgi:DNA-binding LacI/PurR family transcriptional regulator
MNILTVAKKAGVSIATVSRAFNFPEKVSPATRELIQQVARDLGYQPNASARTLRTQRSRVLGVILPTLINPVFAECLQGIAQAAALNGYSIMPFTSNYQDQEEESIVQNLHACGVDGIILVVSDPASSKALDHLHSVQLPYVLAYNSHTEHPCISVAGTQALASVVQHLAALGHQRIAMVCGQRSASDRAQQRYAGFLNGMESAGLQPWPLIEVPFIKAAVEQISGALESDNRPTALICSNDLLAIRAIRAAHLSGLRVPEDLSVTGFDGIQIGEDLTPTLSTVVQPNQEIGQRSVALLVDAIAHGTMPDASASITLPHTFRDGESCAHAAP